MPATQSKLENAEEAQNVEKIKKLMKVVSRGVFCLVMNGVLLANVGPNLVTRLSGSPVNAVRNLSRYATMSALVEFFTTPLIGKISDQIGRRTLMVITPFIIACARLCVFLNPSLFTYAIGKCIQQATATGFFTVWRAGLADMTARVKEKSGFAAANAQIGISAGVAVLFGPLVSSAITSFLGEVRGTTAVYGLSALLMFYNSYLMASSFPETLPEEERRPFNVKDALPWTFVNVMAKSKSLSRSMMVAGLQSVAEPKNIGDVNYLTLHEDYGWSNAKISRQYSLMGLSLIGSGMMVKKSLKTFGLKGHTTISNLMNGLTYVLWGGAKTIYETLGVPMDFTMLLAVACLVPGGRKRDAVENIVVNLGEDSGFGRGYVSGALMNFRAFINIIAPIIIGNVYAWSKQRNGNAPFLAWGICALSCIFAEGVFQTLTNEELLLDDAGNPISGKNSAKQEIASKYKIGQKVKGKAIGWSSFYDGEVIKVYMKKDKVVYDIKFDDGEVQKGMKENRIKM